MNIGRHDHLDTDNRRTLITETQSVAIPQLLYISGQYDHQHTDNQTIQAFWVRTGRHVAIYQWTI